MDNYKNHTSETNAVPIIRHVSFGKKDETSCCCWQDTLKRIEAEEDQLCSLTSARLRSNRTRILISDGVGHWGTILVPSRAFSSISGARISKCPQKNPQFSMSSIGVRGSIILSNMIEEEEMIKTRSTIQIYVYSLPFISYWWNYK